MLRVNTPPSWAPTTHTGKPSPWGTDSPLWPLSQEGLRTVNSHRETNTGLSHTFPQITLPVWWGLMYTAAGGISADPTIPFRSQSRPRSIPTQNRVASSSLGLISVSEVEAKSLGAQCRIPIRFAALWTYLGLGPTQVSEDVWYGRGYHTSFCKMLHASHGKHWVEHH